MKKNKRKLFLPKYKQYMKKEKMENSGLCICFADFEYQEFIDLIAPDWNELGKISISGPVRGYWGSGIKGDPAKYQFTPLRQNLVLLMAALNNEL